MNFQNLKQRLVNWLSRGMAPQLTKQEIEDAQAKGFVLAAEDRLRVTKQRRCNHRKGGIMSSKTGEISPGDARQYAVIKHQHMNGDIWVYCMRCGKKWKPPSRSEYSSEREFYRAVDEYEAAVGFPTNNVTSGAIQLAFVLNGSRDAGHEYVRKQLENS
jgi:hypothetical protein